MIAPLSPNWDSRSRPISLVILHYTGMQTGDIARARLCDPAPLAGRYPGPWQAPDGAPDTPLNLVSAHYLVHEGGAVDALVPDDKRTWHAGQGSWKGEAAVNDRSIGVEIVNGGHDFGLPPYPEAQIAAVISLVADVCARHNLGTEAVLGHSDIAPERKADPGEHFPWQRLAQAGLALWPRRGHGELQGRQPLQLGDRGAHVASLKAGLRAFGYGLAQEANGHFDALLYDALTQACVTAFQRRFRQDRIDGIADGQTRALLADLLSQ